VTDAQKIVLRWMDQSAVQAWHEAILELGPSWIWPDDVRQSPELAKTMLRYLPTHGAVLQAPAHTQEVAQ